MAHSFEVDIAEKYGVNAAILLNNIYFWCQKNKANKHNFFDGNYWTYNSRSAFSEIFPYLSERQIKTALDKLIADGVIKTGCYNKNVWDKSLWYALTDKGWSIMQERRIDIAEMSNRLDEDVRPIPDSKTTDINPDINHSKNTTYSYAERSEEPSAPPEPTVFSLPLNDGTEYGVTQNDFDTYGKLYPSVNVMQELRKMYGWLDSNPSKKKTRRGIKRFINAWLSREQDKGGKATVSEPANPDKPWWINKPWWEWPIEEQQKRERELEAELNGG